MPDTVPLLEAFGGQPEAPAEPAPTGIPLLDRFGPEQALHEARQHARETTRLLNVPETLFTESVPFLSSLIGAGGRQVVTGARERVRQGTARPEDYHTVASDERLQELQQERGVPGQIETALARAPAVLGEFALGGAVVRGVGGLLPRALGGRLLGTGAAEGASLFSRAGLGGAGRLALQGAVATPLVPSTYVPEWTARNEAAGREALDWHGLPPALAHGALGNAIFGAMGQGGARITEAGVRPTIRRLLERTGEGMIAQQGIDALAGVAASALGDTYNERERYGLLGQLARGQWGDAWKKVAVDGVVFAAFAGFHELQQGRPDAQRLMRERQQSLMDHVQFHLQRMREAGGSPQQASEWVNGQVRQFQEAQAPAAAPGAPAAPPAAPEVPRAQAAPGVSPERLADLQQALGVLGVPGAARMRPEQVLAEAQLLGIHRAQVQATAAPEPQRAATYGAQPPPEAPPEAPAAPPGPPEPQGGPPTAPGAPEAAPAAPAPPEATPGPPEPVQRVFQDAFPGGRLTPRGEMQAEIGGRTVYVGHDPATNSVRIDFEAEKPGVPAAVQRGSLDLMRGLRTLVEGLHAQGVGIEYRAVDSNRVTSRRARADIYARTLERAGYEQAGPPEQGVYRWRPKAEAPPEPPALRSVTEATRGHLLDLLEWNAQTATPLDPRARRVLFERIQNATSVRELGEELGISGERVRQLEKEGLQKLGYSGSVDEVHGENKRMPTVENPSVNAEQLETVRKMPRNERAAREQRIEQLTKQFLKEAEHGDLGPERTKELEAQLNETLGIGPAPQEPAAPAAPAVSGPGDRSEAPVRGRRKRRVSKAEARTEAGAPSPTEPPAVSTAPAGPAEAPGAGPPGREGTEAAPAGGGAAGGDVLSQVPPLILEHARQVHASGDGLRWEQLLGDLEHLEKTERAVPEGTTRALKEALGKQPKGQRSTALTGHNRQQAANGRRHELLKGFTDHAEQTARAEGPPSEEALSTGFQDGLGHEEIAAGDEGSGSQTAAAAFFGQKPEQPSLFGEGTAGPGWIGEQPSTPRTFREQQADLDARRAWERARRGDAFEGPTGGPGELGAAGNALEASRQALERHGFSRDDIIQFEREAMEPHANLGRIVDNLESGTDEANPETANEQAMMLEHLRTFRAAQGATGGPTRLGGGSSREGQSPPGVPFKFGAPLSEAERGGAVGGGQAEAWEGRPRWETALANARVDQERALRREPPLMSEARRANPEVWDRAMRTLDRDPEAGARLVEELARKTRATTVDENALLLQRKIALRNEYGRTVSEYVQGMRGGADAVTMTALEGRERTLGQQIDQLDRVTRSTGTEWGRAGQFRRQLAREDYSLSSMLQRALAAHGPGLTQEQRAALIEQVSRQHERIVAADEAVARSEAAVAALVGPEGETPAAAGKRVATSGEFRTLQGDLAEQGAARQDFQQESVDRPRQARQPVLDGWLDLLTKIRRAFLLSGPQTLLKLTSAGTESIAIGGLNEMVGGMLRQIPGLSRIAALAPREGGALSLGREGRVWGAAYTEGVRDALQTLRTGRSELDMIFGHEPLEVRRPWLDFIGWIHAALKAPAKRAEFTRSLLTRIDQAAAQGQDVTSPAALAELGARAYQDANGAIFRDANSVVDAYNRAVRTLTAPDASAGAKAVGYGLKMALPIVRVPTNIVAQTLEYAFGSVTGSARAALALRRGVENLPPAQADVIMRQLKRGSLGAAVLALGYMAPGVVGGFYSGRRDPNDVEAGAIGTVPSYVLHHPLLEALQMGATVRRATDQRVRGQTGGTSEGIAAGAAGLLREVPFLREPMELAKLASSDARERGRAFGDLMKSLAVPQLSSWLAGRLDTTTGSVTGPAVPRSPQTLGQHLQMGIPGLRQQVPERRRALGMR